MSENDSREESLPFNSPHINLFSTASIEINQLQEKWDWNNVGQLPHGVTEGEEYANA